MFNLNMPVAMRTHDIDFRDHAFIYFFTPRKLPNHAVRPYVYNLTTGDTASVFNNVLDRTHGMIDHANTQLGVVNAENARYTNIDEAYHLISPNNYGSLFEGDRVSQNYTFTMVIENASINSRTIERSAPQSNRLIYHGFCIGEPGFSLDGLSYSHNEGCILVPTQFMMVRFFPRHTPQGITYDPQICSNVDIVNSTMVSAYSQERSNLARPEDYIKDLIPLDVHLNGSETPDGGYYMSSLKSVEAQNVMVDKKFALPSAHMSKIMTGIINNYNNLNVGNVGFDDQRINGREYMVGQPSKLTSNFYEKLYEKPVNRLIGLDLNKPIVLGDLIQKYPSLVRRKENMHILEVPYDTGSFTDGMANTPLNTATSLIQQSIPTVLSNYGLASVSLTYTTFKDLYHGGVLINTGEENWSVRVHEALSLVDIDTPSVTANKVALAVDYLRSGLFKYVEEVYGNFEVNIMYNHGGECSIRLNLRDMYENFNNDALVTNEVTSGLSTPIVVNDGTYAHNSETIDTVAMMSAGRRQTSDYPNYSL